MRDLLLWLRAPAWPVLLWAGTAASVAAAWLLPKRDRALEPAATATITRTLALGILLYTPLYGFAFEYARRADIGLGLALGAGHGLLALLHTALTTRAADGRRAQAPHLARVLAAYTAFGGLVGFLYSVPPG
jgi:hypothetical protein